MAEWILQHIDNDGIYQKKAIQINKNFKIKTDQQLRRDWHDGQKRIYKKTGKEYQRAAQVPFSGFIGVDDKGDEYYTFEGSPNTYVMDTYFAGNERLYFELKKIVKEEDVLVIFDLYLKGYTIKKIAEITTLSIKQVRNRIYKIRNQIDYMIGNII